MSDAEHCAYCGGYVDSMNSEAFARFRKDGTEIVWCSEEHFVATGRCDYCGMLAWTIGKYGRITHKHNCPHRHDAYCQAHAVCRVEDDVSEVMP